MNGLLFSVIIAVFVEEADFEIPEFGLSQSVALPEALMSYRVYYLFTFDILNYK